MKWFYNLKIGTKLVVSFGIGLLVLLMIVFIAISNSSKLDKGITYINQNVFPKTIWADNVINLVDEESKCIRDMLLTNDQQAVQVLMAKMNVYIASTSENYDSLQRAISSDDGKAVLAKVLSERIKYNLALQNTIDAVKTGNKDSALAIISGQFHTAEVGYMNVINSFIDLENQKVNEAAKQANQTNNNSKNLLLFIGGLTFLLVISFGYSVTKSITKPIFTLNEAALKVANGDLNVLVENNQKDEIGELTISFNKMSEKISQMFNDFNGLPFPVMMIDKEFNITYMNNAGAQICGQDQKSLLGQKCYDHFKTEHCNTQNCATNLAMQLNKPKSAETIARPLGKAIPIFYSAKPNIDKHGKVVGGIEYITDTTNIKEQEKYLDENVHKLLAEMIKLSDGDLTVELSASKKDDVIAKLFNGFNKVVLSLRQIIERISEAVSATASASTQISSSSEEMAAGAQEQSTQAQEVAAAVEQMTKTILETTKNAGNTADEAKNAGQFAKDGGKVISETIDGMNRIAVVVTKAAETVQELGKSSDQIGEIVQVIDDIADQTNLLALNAAIEAARAGEQGRGFAVVADEVRKLAERTTKATKEIADMIKRIQKDTSGAVESIQQGTAEAQKGKSLAAKAGESLEQIITGSAAVVDSATQVAAASEEQSATAEQISKNIEAINNVTQESAAGVQQIAHAAEDLNRLTDNLQNLVSKFNIDSERRNDRSTLAVRSNGHIVHAS